MFQHTVIYVVGILLLVPLLNKKIYFLIHIGLKKWMLDISYKVLHFDITSLCKFFHIYNLWLFIFNRFVTVEVEMAYNSAGSQTKLHHWVEAKNSNGKLHKLKCVLSVSCFIHNLLNCSSWALIYWKINSAYQALSFLLPILN